MLQARCWLAALAGMLLYAAGADAQEPGILAESQLLQDTGTPESAPVVVAQESLLPLTLTLDDRGFPPPGPPYSLFSPFELYARGGFAVNLGDGILDRTLRTGKSFTFGARSFRFNEDNSAAWTADVAIEYIYNNARESEVVLTREGTTAVNRLGTTVNLPTITEYTIPQLHRTSGRVAVGREWYFGGEDWRGVRLNFGMDVGGKLGHVSAKLFVLDRQIDGLQQFDQLPNFNDGHTSSVNKGVFVGVNTGVLLPMDGYDISFGGRFEWGQDWFLRISNNDRGLEMIQGQLFVGVRF